MCGLKLRKLLAELGEAGYERVMIVGAMGSGKTCVSNFNEPTTEKLVDSLRALDSEFGTGIDTIANRFQNISMSILNAEEASKSLRESLESIAFIISDVEKYEEPYYPDEPIYNVDKTNPHFKARKNYKQKLKKNKR